MSKTPSDISNYYERAIIDGGNDDLSFYELPADVYEFLRNKVGVGVISFDIGYGAGHCSKWLHDCGCDVVSVDLIEPSLAFEDHYLDSIRMSVHQASASDFRITRMFDILVARNVLHFMSREVVGNLIEEWATQSKPSAHMYLTCFTNIERTDSEGNRQLLRGEANFEAEEFIDLIRCTLGSWRVSVEIVEHQQTNKNGRPYFLSRNVIAKCRKE